MAFNINGAWWHGECATPGCGNEWLYRSTADGPQLNEEFCRKCGKYSIIWEWLVVVNAKARSANRPAQVEE